MDSRQLLKQAKAARELQSKPAVGKKESSRIDSPFASYDSTGKLKCGMCLIRVEPDAFRLVLCNVHVKSDALFHAHIATKQHKDRMTQLLQAKEQVKSQLPTDLPTKRKVEQEEPVENKKVHTEKPSLVLTAAYDSESDSDEVTAEPEPVKTVNEADEENDKNIEEAPKSILSALPAGFFDTIPDELAAEKEQLEKDDFEKQLAMLKKEIEEDELKLKDQRTVVSAEPSIGKNQAEELADAIVLEENQLEASQLDNDIESIPDMEEILLEEERKKRLREFQQRKAQLHQRVLNRKTSKNAKKSLAEAMKEIEVSSEEEDSIGNWRSKLL